MRFYVDDRIGRVYVAKPSGLGSILIALIVGLLLAVMSVAVLGGFLVCSTATYGKQEYMKNTKKQCVYCHAKVSPDKDAMNKNLTDAGKYYAEHKSLDGFQDKK